MRVYADSSFLVSCYLVDANTSRAKAFLSKHHGPLPFTALHELEVRNAVRLGVFRRVITDEGYGEPRRSSTASLTRREVDLTLKEWLRSRQEPEYASARSACGMSSSSTSRSTSLDSSSKSLGAAEPNTSRRRTRYFLHRSASARRWPSSVWVMGWLVVDSLSFDSAAAWLT